MPHVLLYTVPLDASGVSSPSLMNPHPVDNDRLAVFLNQARIWFPGISCMQICMTVIPQLDC